MNDDLSSWISEARWFGGKGRDWTLTSVRRVGELPDAPQGLRVAIQLAEVTYDDGSTDLYQLPLAFYAEQGFVEIDRRRRYYRDGATAVVLRLPLVTGCGGG